VQGKTGETHHVQAIWVDIVTINGKQYVRAPHALIPAVEWNWFQAHANEIAAGTIVMAVTLVLIGLPVLMPLDTVLLTSEIPSDTAGWSDAAPQNVLSKEIEITREGDFWRFEIPPQTTSKPVPIDPSTRLPVGVDPFDVVGKDASGNSLTWVDLQRWLVTRSRQLGGPPPPTIGADEMTPGVMVPIWFIHASTTVQTTQATAQITAVSSFQNGDFESGILSPWVALGQGQAVVTNQQVHSGSYALSITAPPENNPNGGGNIMTVQQEFAPMPLPLTFSASIYNLPYPTTYCSHPFTQWGIYDTTGHALEAGFSYPGGEAWSFSKINGAEDWHWTRSYSPNQWVQLSVEVYSDHYNFYVNGQSVHQGQASEGWTFTSIYKVQLFNSCSATAYFDDVQFSPINQTIITPVIEAWDRFWAWVWCRFGYCST
jgi:hypothetical protein